MTDKVDTPVSGNPESKGDDDGVSGVPDEGGGRSIHGRSSAGESGGGSYPNPYSGMKPTNTGFMKHGGQTENAYYGSGQAGEEGGSAPNAVAGSSGDGDDVESRNVPKGYREEHDVQTGTGAVAVTLTSGVAAAEASGKIGTDGDDKSPEDQAGSG